MSGNGGGDSTEVAASAQSHDTSGSALDTAEVAAYGRFTAAAIEVACSRSFNEWCDQLLRPFIGFEQALCCLGHSIDGRFSVDMTQAIGWLPDAIPAVGAASMLSTCPALDRCFTKGEPQGPSTSLALCLPGCLCGLGGLGGLGRPGGRLTKGARFSLMHGTKAVDGRPGSYFRLEAAGMHDGNSLRLKARMVAPYLHHALVAVAWRHTHDLARQVASTPLSPRELEVLAWVQAGKTNSEIAAIQSRSPDTIKHQVRSLMAKLQVSNRSQAVSRAFDLGLLQHKRRTE